MLFFTNFFRMTRFQFGDTAPQKSKDMNFLTNVIFSHNSKNIPKLKKVKTCKVPINSNIVSYTACIVLKMKLIFKKFKIIKLL